MNNQALRFPGGSLSDEYHWASNTTGANTWTWATSFDNGAGSLTITWTVHTGFAYQVEFCDALGGPWLPIGQSRTASASDVTLSRTDYPPSSVTQRFYRIAQLP